MASGAHTLNSRADVLGRQAALQATLRGATGLMEVMKTNLGPSGTYKMLVGGAGQIKMTKDGAVLMSEMQIQHPTASMLARCATAQDSESGDGTTSVVLIIGELLRQCERYITDGVHARVLCDGIDKARDFSTGFLEKFKHEVMADDREKQLAIARTTLKTKISPDIAEKLANHIVDSVEIISRCEDDDMIDLNMVEVMTITQNLTSDCRLVKGMVMDHGCRHPDMPKELKNCYILTCNVSLEYEKTEVNASFFYSSVDQREKMIESERSFVDKKVKKIIDLKRAVCTNGEGFVVLNQKGIDPISLDMMAREGIMALRRVKRRNMERLTKCCGGKAVNSVDELVKDDLGYAGHVHEMEIDDAKWTFVEEVKEPVSCCIVIKGPADYSIAQIKDAIRDGLRAVRNVKKDKALVPGGGAFELACSAQLRKYADNSPHGKAKLGIYAFADALQIIPLTLAENCGYDAQGTVLSMLDEYLKFGGDTADIGVDMNSEHPSVPSVEEVWDNYSVKKQLLSLVPMLAQQLLLVDEVIKAGKSMVKE